MSTPESPVAQRLREMREMRAYWLAHIDSQSDAYGPQDAADMAEHATAACRQTAAIIIGQGVQPCAAD